jgi:hypothetical protein
MMRLCNTGLRFRNKKCLFQPTLLDFIKYLFCLLYNTFFVEKMLKILLWRTHTSQPGSGPETTGDFQL